MTIEDKVVLVTVTPLLLDVTDDAQIEAVAS
jgi:hypothetical protein